MCLFSNVLKSQLPDEIYENLINPPFPGNDNQNFELLRNLDCVRKEERTFYTFVDPEIKDDARCVVNWDRSDIFLYNEDRPVDLTKF